MATLHDAHANHEKCDFGQWLDDRRIGHNLCWRTVEENVVELLLGLTNHLLKSLALKQFRWIWHGPSCGEHIEVFMFVQRLDKVAPRVALATQIGRNALTRAANVLRNRTLAQVEVEHEHFLIRHGERGCQIGHNKRLARARVDGSHHDNLVARTVRLRRHHEDQIRTQDSERFVNHILAITPDFQHFMHIALVLSVRLYERQFAHKRHLQMLQILAAAHLRIEQIHDDDDGQWNDQTRHERIGLNPLHVGRNRFETARRGTDEARIVGDEGLIQLGLLSFLQEVNVEFFLHILLTLNALQVF